MSNENNQVDLNDLNEEELEALTAPTQDTAIVEEESTPIEDNEVSQEDTEITSEEVEEEVAEEAESTEEPAPAVVEEVPTPVEEPVAEATTVRPGYPENMPGEFFKQYDKLSAVGKSMINVVYEHMIVAGPDRALSDADGARRQASLYHAIVGILNLPRPEFDAGFALLLATFLKFPKGAFSEACRLRWMQFIQLNKSERNLFSVLMTMLPELADGRTRKQIFRQYEKRFEKTLVESTGSTRLSKDAAKNVVAFFRK